MLAGVVKGILFDFLGLSFYISHPVVALDSIDGGCGGYCIIYLEGVGFVIAGIVDLRFTFLSND